MGKECGMCLGKAPLSIKLLCSSIMASTGLVYVVLLVHIWIDTEMKVGNIAQSYGMMEYIELTTHAHHYLPYYLYFLFLVPITIFMFTRYSQKVKCFFAVFPFLVIIVDIGSMYLIPYAHEMLFSVVLLIAGSTLGFTFLLLFLGIVGDLWILKPKEAESIEE